MRARPLGYAVPFLGLLVVLLLLGGLPAALAAPGAWHEDERLGYKVRYPKGWSIIPMNIDEKWIAAKFLSDSADFFTSKDEGWTYDHKPQMSVIAFISEVVKKRGAEVSETDDGFLIELNNPFKDYEDYLKRTYSGGGWYISEDEQGTVNGISVRQLEIKVEKLTRSGPKRIVAWVYQTEEVDYVVQFELLEGAYRKRKRDMHACLRSFKLIPRKGSLTPTTTGKRVIEKDEDELTLEERTLQRQQKEANVHEKTVAALPDDWKVKEMGRFLVLNHADDKYAKKVVSHAEAVWKWLDKNFDYLGPGEYVPRPIIRICKDADEERAFSQGTAWGPSIEIVTHKDTSGGSLSWEFEWINRRIVGLWFRYHAGDIYSAFPHWLDNGLDQVLGTARAKGSRLEFQADQWELQNLREAVRKDQITPLQDLLKMGTEDFYGQRTRSSEAAAFLRLLLSTRSKKVKAVLKEYILNLAATVEDIKAKEKAAGPKSYKAPETEEEEEQQAKQRRQRWKDKENELLTAVFDKTFGNWEEKDWKKLNDAHRKNLD